MKNIDRIRNVRYVFSILDRASGLAVRDRGKGGEMERWARVSHNFGRELGGAGIFYFFSA
jgi:hypothetical protein